MPALVNPSSARYTLNSGTVDPTVANVAIRAMTAEPNASRSFGVVAFCAVIVGALIVFLSGTSSSRRDRAGGNTHPRAVPLRVRVRVERFLHGSVGDEGVPGASVDQSEIAEEAHARFDQFEILEGAGLGDVLQVLLVVPRDSRSLSDEVV